MYIIDLERSSYDPTVKAIGAAGCFHRHDRQCPTLLVPRFVSPGPVRVRCGLNGSTYYVNNVRSKRAHRCEVQGERLKPRLGLGRSSSKVVFSILIADGPDLP